MKRRLAGSYEKTEINVSPLIDMVFILLIFFIVATSFVNEIGISSTYKDSASPNLSVLEPLTFDLTSSGQILQNGKPVSLGEIAPIGHKCNGSSDARGCFNRKTNPAFTVSKSLENSLLPGLESEKIKGIRRKSFLLAAIFSMLLFGLLPLSEFAKNEQWLVRDTLVPAMPSPPPPPPTDFEKFVEKV